jgi:hypothetical protein
MSEHPSWTELGPALLQPDVHNALIDILSVIEIPNDAQQLVSAEKTPTLSITIPTYETLIGTWELQAKSIALCFLRPFIRQGVEDMQHYMGAARSNKVYALAMSEFLHFLSNWQF